MSKSSERNHRWKCLTAYQMKQEGKSLKQIADFIGCHKCQVGTMIKFHKRMEGIE